MSASPWFLRAMSPEDVRDLAKLWLASWWTSHYARRQYRYEEGKRDYEATHGPRIQRILRRSDVRIVCDPERPDVVYAFAVVERGCVHYVMVKRSCHREGLGPELVRMMLGDLLDKPAKYTHELVEFDRNEMRDAGMRLPAHWTHDPWGAEAA